MKDRDDDETSALPTSARTGAEGDVVLFGDELERGANAGEYIIQGIIASGGCGTVYRAEHRVLGRRAAVKVLHREMAASPEMLQRFVREARAVNLIGHPNIVDIYEFGQLQDGRPYFVMELLEGSTLEALVQERGRLAPAEALEILEPVCAALSATHEAGVIHRDLKASNVAVSSQGNRFHVKLLDFGIAKLVEHDGEGAGLTSVNRHIGTPNAMAPEQIRGGRVDARTDVYALGVLVYHVLTGQFPFQAADPREIERLHLEAAPPPPSQCAPISAAIDAVVLRCLEKLPERRFASAAAFLEALRDAVDGTSPQAKRTPGPPVSKFALGVYVDIRIAADAQEQMDDALLDDLAGALKLAERELVSEGFAFALQTGSAVLAARVLPDDLEAAAAERQRLLAAVVVLHDRIGDRQGRDPRIHVNLSVHVDRVLARIDAQATEFVSGGLLRIGAWVADRDLTEICATRACLQGIPAALASRFRVRET